MSNKQWFIVYLVRKHGMERHLLEHYIVPEFENLADYNRWRNEITDYFRKRTGITGGQIAAIEPSEVISVFEFRKEDGYEG